MKRRVVITGVGLVTPVGLDPSSTWRALVAGKSGAGPITQFDASDHGVRFACEVKDFDVEGYMDSKDARRADRFLQFAMVSAAQALEQAGFLDDFGDVPTGRVGVIVGSGIGGLPLLERQHTRLIEGGPGRVSPFFIPMFIADMAPGMIAMRYGAQGPNYATVSACASSAHAIGMAFRSVRDDEADIMVAGGTESTITPLAVAGFTTMKALSTRNEAPDSASRPFDAHRDGFVLGEGSGMLILEELVHAIDRGAEIFAEIIGFGQSADAHHITAPSPDGSGARAAMEHALRDAGLAPSDVDYINAHGTSTPANDVAETRAVKDVFGSHAYELVIGSTKSMTGHTLGAAGAIEAAISAEVCRRGTIPPTINLEETDPECDLEYAHGGVIERPVEVAISNSFGFGGHNGCLAIRRWNGEGS
jgi:3-oxoacyl-[acyl-carrier-protein] synthase II